jgi:hypothetical protein
MVAKQALRNGAWHTALRDEILGGVSRKALTGLPVSSLEGTYISKIPKEIISWNKSQGEEALVVGTGWSLLNVPYRTILAR